MDWRGEDVSPFSEDVPALALSNVGSQSQQSGGSSRNTTASKSRLIWSNEKWIKVHYGAGTDDLEYNGEFQQWITSESGEQLFEVNVQQSMTKLHLTHTLLARTDEYSLSIVTSVVPSDPINSQRTTKSDDNDNRMSTDSTITSLSSDPSPSLESTGFQLNRKRPATRSSTHSSVRQGARLGPGSPGPDRNLMFQNRMLSNTSDCWAQVDRMDWSKTSLGPRSKWPVEFEALLALCFQSPSQDSLWLGDELILI
jgi:hypothetical protein